MNGFVRRLAARLLELDRAGEAPLSRNRHFEVFSDEHGRSALRIFRHLRSVRRDILASARATVQRGFGGDSARVRLIIALPGARAERTAFLSSDELELLLESPGIRARLAG